MNYKIGVFFGDQRNTTWPDALTTPGNLTTLLTSLFALNPDCLAKSETFNSAFDTFSGDTNKIKFKDGTAANKKTTILLRVKALMRAVLQLKKYHLGYETMFADLTGKGVLPPFGSRFSNFFRFGTVRYYHKAIAFSYTDILKMTKPDVAAPAPNATATSVIGSKIVVGGVAGPNDVATPTPAAEAGGAEGGFYKTHYLEVKKYIDNSGPDDNLFAPGRLSQLRPNTFNSWKKIICRRLVCAMIEHCRANDDLFSSFKVTTNYPSGSALFKPLTPFTDHDWAAYVSGIDFKERITRIGDGISYPD